jgi:hypothetical protein
MALGQLVVRFGLDAADFTQGMSKAEADAKRLGDSIHDSIYGAKVKAAAAFAAISGAAVLAFKVMNDQVEAIASFQQLSEKIGDTAENLASLKKASDVSGTSMDSIAAASVKLTAALSKTDEEGQGAAKAIKALGLDFDAFKALSPVDQIEAVSKAMNGFEDGANKTAVAVALWGKSGADMIPLLNDLAEGSQRQITLTQDQILAADNFSKSIARLVSDSGTLRQQLVAQLIPTLSDLLKGFTDVGTEAGNSAEKAKPFAGVMEFIRQEIKKTVADTYDAISTFKQFGVILQTTTNFLSKMPSGLLKFDMTESKNALLEMRPQLDAITGKYLALANAARKAGDTFKDPRVLGDPGSIADQVRAGKELNFSGIKTPKAKAPKVEKAPGAEKLSEAEKYLANLQRQLEATEKLTVVEALQRDITLGRLGVLLPAQQESLVLIAQQIDAVKAKELAEKVAATAAKERWDLEKKSILEVFKSYDETEKAKAALGESLRLSVQTQTEELVALEATYKAAIDNKIISQETFERLMGKVRERYEALSPAVLNFNDLAKTGAESLSSGLADAIVQGKSLADVFKSVVKQLAAMILKALIFKALEIGLNAVSPGLGTAVTAARAVGGPVNQGKSYLVGEKGPELFSPNNSGRITTNAQTFKSQGSGGGQYGNVYNITAPGVSREEFTAGLNRSQQGAVGDVRDNALRRRK